ncbi:hypothetical protein TL16_g07635 [Triparma laevis f. inornata]|uniref:Uncharacterized protein n=1 Tax=Triparma laevis f. inornata TaxID=1714386 RepID=A0A9W7AWV9_9STRA|nr:hypothetical protein TL16_g07635 [Triparma laevis f. inornata]
MCAICNLVGAALLYNSIGIFSWVFNNLPKTCIILSVLIALYNFHVWIVVTKTILCSVEQLDEGLAFEIHHNDATGTNVFYKTKWYSWSFTKKGAAKKAKELRTRRR